MPRIPKSAVAKRPPSINLVFASHLLLFLALGCVLFFIVPGFDATFREMELDRRQPTSTRFFVHLSRLVVRFWYLVILLALPYYFAVRGIYQLNHRRPGLMVFWAILVWYAGAFFLIYLSFCLTTAFLTGSRNLSL